MTPLTKGIDHAGLTVPDLAETLAFFTDCLGWNKRGGNEAYPSAYVSDDSSTITLWQAKTDTPVTFDRHANIGLHHLALKIANEDDLNALFEQVKNWPKVNVEFAPEFSGKGPKVHFMINEPGGNRLEFSYDPR